MISPLYAHMLGEFPSEVWALAIGLAWLLLASSVDDALLILGTRRAKTARQMLGTTELAFRSVYGKNYRKPPYLMVKTMVSCRFSLKPIQWYLVFGWTSVDIYDIYDIYLMGTPPRKHGLMRAGSPSQQQLSSRGPVVGLDCFLGFTLWLWLT